MGYVYARGEYEGGHQNFKLGLLPIFWGSRRSPVEAARWRDARHAGAGQGWGLLKLLLHQRLER